MPPRGRYGLPADHILIVCLLAEHALLLLKFYVTVKLDDTPLWCAVTPHHTRARMRIATHSGG